MSGFHKQGFSARFAAMGDEAEGVADSVFPKLHKLGLNRPAFSLTKLSLKARYTPDRMDENALVEVMGCGRDQIIKVKVEKIVALLQWTATDPVDVFLWDTKNKRWTRGPFDQFVDALFQHGSYDEFPEGKAYVGLHCTHVPFEWTTVDE